MDPSSNAFLHFNGQAQYSSVPLDRGDPYLSVIYQRELQRGGIDAHPTNISSSYPVTSASITALQAETTSANPSQYASTGSNDLDAPSESPEHIKRPRNAFMIFRAEFNSTSDKISRAVERDHRHISRIVGHYWNQMSEEQKLVWRIKADQEKIEHMRKYPNYKFTPAARTKTPRKRIAKRNGADDMERCKRVAEFLLEGKEGEELAFAVKDIDTKKFIAEVKPTSSSRPRPVPVSPPETDSSMGYYALDNPLPPPERASQYSASHPFVADRYNASDSRYNAYHAFHQTGETVDMYARTTPQTSAMRSSISVEDYAPYSESPFYNDSPTYLHSPCSPYFPVAPGYGQQQPNTYSEWYTESSHSASFRNISSSETSVEVTPHYGYDYQHHDMQPTSELRMSESKPPYLISRGSFVHQPPPGYTSAGKRLSSSDARQEQYADHQRRY